MAVEQRHHDTFGTFFGGGTPLGNSVQQHDIACSLCEPSAQNKRGLGEAWQRILQASD